jgi:hypothetical protein
MKEFDEFLDKSKAPKATLPLIKKKKKNRTSSIGKRPLSQTPGLNSPIVYGLIPNLSRNNRLKLLQIAGMAFSKDSWNGIMNAIKCAKSLDTLAINK